MVRSSGGGDNGSGSGSGNGSHSKRGHGRGRGHGRITTLVVPMLVAATVAAVLVWLAGAAVVSTTPHVPALSPRSTGRPPFSASTCSNSHSSKLDSACT